MLPASSRGNVQFPLGSGRGATRNQDALEEFDQIQAKLKHEKSIAASHTVIQHDSQSTVDVLIQPVYREWFEYIKDSKKNKSAESDSWIYRGKAQGDELAHNFVNDDQARIAVADDFFRCSGTEDTQHEKKGDQAPVGSKGQATKSKPEEDREGGAPGARSFGEIATVGSSGYEHVDAIHGNTLVEVNIN